VIHRLAPWDSRARTMGQPARTVGQPARTVGQPARAVGQPARAVGQPADTVGQPGSHGGTVGSHGGTVGSDGGTAGSDGGTAGSHRESPGSAVSRPAVSREAFQERTLDFACLGDLASGNFITASVLPGDWIRIGARSPISRSAPSVRVCDAFSQTADIALTRAKERGYAGIP
jgi:hypothetical protein